MRTREVIEQLLRKFKVTLHACRSHYSCGLEILTHLSGVPPALCDRHEITGSTEYETA